jgi:hypothetical protein
MREVLIAVPMKGTEDHWLREHEEQSDRQVASVSEEPAASLLLRRMQRFPLTH